MSHDQGTLTMRVALGNKLCGRVVIALFSTRLSKAVRQELVIHVSFVIIVSVC
jgi:hypothetical protein